MKYFFDTEFIEGFKKPIKWLPTIGSFNKPYHSIQLISIGIVCEDGREYYAISYEFDEKDASEWVVNNVISKLGERYFNGRNAFSAKLWRTNDQIKREILQFFKYKAEWTDYGSDIFSEDDDISVYAYYADYDWVVLCSLFGTMMDLPKGFPMYCRDLKQEIDRIANKAVKYRNDPQWKKFNIASEYISTEDALRQIKGHEDYPTQQNEHNALDDAKWNFKLYEFLKTL